MKILITAFGPFGGRTENASLLALRALKKMHLQIRSRILPVDAVIAPSRLKHAIRDVRPDALIMLGEAAASTEIRLESTAWNELDFRIPDLAGRVIERCPICKDSPPARKSTLPLTVLSEQLRGSGHPVTLSHDAGRYLCNQLFYVALEYLDQHAIAVPAGFIHLPLETVYPTSRVAAALAQIIQILNHRLGGPRA